MTVTSLFSSLKRDLFLPPKVGSVKISPDASTVAWVGRDDGGILNLFVESRDGKRQLTQFTGPVLSKLYFSADGKKIIFPKSEGLKCDLCSIDLSTEEVVNYTERFGNVGAKIVKISEKTNEAVIGLNTRNPQFHDLYRLNFDTGECARIFENTRYAQFLLNDDLQIALKLFVTHDGSWVIEKGDGSSFVTYNLSESFASEWVDCIGGDVLLLDNRESDKTNLIAKSLSDGSEKRLASGGKTDVEDVLIVEKKVVAYATYHTKKKWHILDDGMAKDFAILWEKLGDNFVVVSQSRGEEVWMVATGNPEEGRVFWRYDRDRGEIEEFGERDGQGYAKMERAVFHARDGKELICYYTLPQGYEKGKKYPLVVTPHGGPFKVRNRYEYHRDHQWLASRGYIGLSVNFRMSAGLGKEFVCAGNGQWGKAAHEDILDAIDGMVDLGIADREKIAVFGGSYGGYEALASLAFSPDVFNCAVSICGPSHLKTVLDGCPLFWERPRDQFSDRTVLFTKRAFVTNMGGDPEEEEGLAYLESCSPLNFIDQIEKPLLLAHGGIDHIVKEWESRQIYDKMKESGRDVHYVLYPDEGHGFYQMANQVHFYDLAEKFLAEHLGGRYTPVDPSETEGTSGIIHR